MNTIASRDQTKLIRIGENLVVNYNVVARSRLGNDDVSPFFQSFSRKSLMQMDNLISEKSKRGNLRFLTFKNS